MSFRENLLAALFLEKHQEWLLFALVSLSVALYAVADVYLKLATVRPLLIFVLVDEMSPPVCGFCVLGL